MLSSRPHLIFAPNASWLFPELTFRERLAAIQCAGFDCIEFGFPSHADLDALCEAHDDLGLKIVNFNQDVPVWDRQNRGYLSDPARRDEFRTRLAEAITLALRLGAQKVMLPAGVHLDGMDPGEQRDCLIANLHAAVPVARDAGILLTLEVLNPVDNPGYFLTTSPEALAILAEIDDPQVKFQFDTYHLERQEGRLVELIHTFAGRIGHIQFADYPGRHEPGSGAIDFGAVLDAIVSAGYQGAIGLEYVPTRSGAASLDWVPAGMRNWRDPWVPNSEEKRG